MKKCSGVEVRTELHAACGSLGGLLLACMHYVENACLHMGPVHVMDLRKKPNQEGMPRPAIYIHIYLFFDRSICSSLYELM